MKTVFANIVSALCLASVSLAAQLTLEELEQDSSHWPIFVKAKSELKHPESDRSIKPNTRVVFVRFEGGKVVVDAGRGGVHVLEPEETNVLDEANAVRDGTSPKTAPLLVGHLSLRTLKPGTLTVKNPKVYQDIKYALLFYCAPDFEQHRDLLSKLEEIAKLDSREHAEFVVFGIPVSKDRTAIENFIEDSGEVASFPFVFPHLSYGYALSFHHDAVDEENLPLVVLCDANGKILAHSGRLGGGEEAIHSVIDEARNYAVKSDAPSED